ncbi:carboxyl transferase domain-containing protein [Desulfuribacillus alkaliarsenatis]|uniref:CoA carboxyltransferase C-terminal domain-containing protein n=1 Tax=Desulfuribacillus alkaliarsenatis TaxID=766136 RepID=A0A1E5G033_9FIRM|nr:carboxyl transferase domain-containing protein [Desulfuribacillus alkaliarsenatis]OEF96103.1 hypothetical protein BHF68_10235 [Desulfuribacillus alkaliarsenatis]
MSNQLLNDMILHLADFETFNSTGNSMNVDSGFATISGKPVCIFVVSGGIGQTEGRIIANTVNMAIKAGTPIIGLWDSLGAIAEEGQDVFSGYGQILQSLAQASGIVPRILGLIGQSVGTASLIPALMDCVIAVRGSSLSYINTPEVTKIVSGENFELTSMANADVLEQVNATAHMVTEDGQQCLIAIKKVLEYLPSNNIDETEQYESLDKLEFDSSKVNSFDYDMEQLLSTIVDGGTLLPVQRNYGKSIITSFGRVDGQPVGIIANQSNYKAGCMESEGLSKASRFIGVCNAFNIPIITFVNSQGFLPGIDQELGGIARQAAKLFQAYADATVPKITIIVGKAYGGAFICMGSKWNGADLVYAWPNSQIAPTNINAMIQLMYHNRFSLEDDSVAFREQALELHKDEFTSPHEAYRKGYIDKVIEPTSTSIHISNALCLFAGKRVAGISKKHSVMPM